ncbi:MAG: NAD-dependent epimerase/dehydratase family protein [Micrococcaceae bacterium]
MKILITGGAGFIGSNLAKYILKQDPKTEIVILDDLSTGFKENIEGLDVKFIEGTILDEKVVEEACAGVDSVVHLAAIGSVPRSIDKPKPSNDANTRGTLNILDAARLEGVEQVIVASSSAVYGANPKLPREESDWTRPISPYGVSKLATEGYAIAYQHSYGMKTVAFRFFNVYGPAQSANHAYAAVIPQFVHAALHKKPLPLNGDGTQSRDFTYVETLCEVVWEAIVNKLSYPSPINLAFGDRIDLNGVIDLIQKDVGYELDVERRPDRPGDIKASQANATILKSLFPDVKATPIEDGLTETIEWYKKSNN